MRINMLPHCFPVKMFTQLYNRDAAFTKLNDDATNRPDEAEFGMVLNQVNGAWCFFDVGADDVDGGRLYITPHRCYADLCAALAYVRFLRDFRLFDDSRVGVVRRERRWLVFRINQQKHPEQSLIERFLMSKGE